MAVVVVIASKIHLLSTQFLNWYIYKCYKLGAHAVHACLCIVAIACLCAFACVNVCVRMFMSNCVCVHLCACVCKFEDHI